MIKLKIIINCGPCEEFIEKCIASVRSQSFIDWEAYVTVDPCGDKTFERAVIARGDDVRIRIHRNRTRLYSMVNLIRAIGRSNAQSDDIIAVLDGDDWFATRDALQIIADKYTESNCWMTYGSWVTDWPNPRGIRDGRWPAYPEGTVDFRAIEWLGTAVRTWKRWLWDLIDDRDFRDAEGKYFMVTEDQAALLPMLEMSGTDRARHIQDVLMVYNRSSPYGCCFTRREEMVRNGTYLRTRPPYFRLQKQPDSASEVASLRASRTAILNSEQCDLAGAPINIAVPARDYFSI